MNIITIKINKFCIYKVIDKVSVRWMQSIVLGLHYSFFSPNNVLKLVNTLCIKVGQSCNNILFITGLVELETISPKSLGTGPTIYIVPKMMRNLERRGIKNMGFSIHWKTEHIEWRNLGTKKTEHMGVQKKLGDINQLIKNKAHRMIKWVERKCVEEWRIKWVESGEKESNLLVDYANSPKEKTEWGDCRRRYRMPPEKSEREDAGEEERGRWRGEESSPLIVRKRVLIDLMRDKALVLIWTWECV